MSTLTADADAAVEAFGHGSDELQKLGEGDVKAARELEKERDRAAHEAAEKIKQAIYALTPINEWLEGLKGDTATIDTLISQWKELGSGIQTAHESHLAMATDMPSWEGPEALAYRRVHRSTSKVFVVAGTAMNAMSLALALAKELLLKMHEFIDSCIEAVIAKAVKRGITAGVPVIGWAIAVYDAWEFIDKAYRGWNTFTGALETIKNVLQNAGNWFNQAKAALERMQQSLTERITGLPAELKDKAVDKVKDKATGAITDRVREEAVKKVEARQTRLEERENRAAANMPSIAKKNPDDYESPSRTEKAKEDVETAQEKVARYEKKLNTAGSFLADNTGYHYPVLPADEPLMPLPKGKDNIEAIQELKAKRKPTLR